MTPTQQAFVASVPASVGIPYLCAAAASSFTALFGNTPIYPGATFPSTSAPVPASFTGLLSTIGNFPISEKGSIYSLRFDHMWNSQNTTFVRGMISPDSVDGIQVNAQNQTLRPKLRESHFQPADARLGYHRPAHDGHPQRPCSMRSTSNLRAAVFFTASRIFPGVPIRLSILPAPHTSDENHSRPRIAWKSATRSPTI